VPHSCCICPGTQAITPLITQLGNIKDTPTGIT
jgi:hypothetical protein